MLAAPSPSAHQQPQHLAHHAAGTQLRVAGVLARVAFATCGSRNERSAAAALKHVMPSSA
jgi:hypothetical protein